MKSGVVLSGRVGMAVTGWLIEGNKKRQCVWKAIIIIRR